MLTRNRTPSKYVYYGLHLYFSGLSLRKASERLSQIYTREITFPFGIGFKSTSLKS
ncbi:hypothetical protein [Candidatus Nitrosocosmicus sp. SS]|uniref:hypothetical protein n=1 Tax=Candidatus Nitrosocosmicus agrestis TaxID=2563600 RepID=UPI0012B5505E|nr:hypothetical protein [Candidatus Nitrosocosmicus sp. SS]